MPVAVRNSSGSDSPAQVPLLRCLPFSTGAGHSLIPKGTALHGPWITAMWIHMDPQFPLPLTPLPALWGLQGTPAPASAHSPAWSSGKGGRMIPRKEWGEGGS